MADLVPLGEELEAGEPLPRRQRWASTGLLAGCIGMVMLCMFAPSPFAPARKPSSPPARGQIQHDVGSIAAPRSMGQHSHEIVVTPPREECAKIGYDCFSQRCCKVSGYTCYLVKPERASCMKECTPGVDGTCLAQAVTAPAANSSVTLSSTNLFCFAVYTKWTGSARISHELELLRTNLFLGTSIFGCEAYRVYSDVSTWLSPDSQVQTVKVDDTRGDFHFAKRRETGTWINSNIFIAVWKKIEEENMWAGKDWVVKVDADAVFLPTRLREKLGTQKVTSNGIYLENCKYVNFGVFGNLEVLSHKAAETYIANLDDCRASLNYMGREKVTGNEPWGEDLFAQRCMDLHGVDRVAAWDITTDGACEAFRPEGQKKNKKWKPDCAVTQTAAMHPFKTPEDYFDCLKATQR